MTQAQTHICPTCHQKTLVRVTRDIEGSFKKQHYVARDVTISECTHCGERLYDFAAMTQIEAARPKPTRRGVA